MAPELSEQVKHAIAIAHRAQGFAQYLNARGLIGRGNEVREAIESILSVELTEYPDFVLASRVEVAEALERLLDSYRYNSGEPTGEHTPQCIEIRQRAIAAYLSSGRMSCP